jgi:c(7)-type cytochrome triheme protein
LDVGLSYRKRRAAVLLLDAVLVLAVAGCSRRLLSVFLDLPPRPQQAAPRPVTPPAASGAHAGVPTVPIAPADTPAIERTLDPDSVVKLLPRDNAGNVDWMAAVKRGIINPRPALPGRPAPAAGPGAFQFKFDFYFKGPDTTFDAFFPHSSHTAWVDCQQCHARIFPYRGAELRMGDIFAGKYCGECHGKVSFPTMTGCERCHTRLKMPPNRAKPELIGTITLARAKDTTRADGTIAGNAAGVRTDDFPAARFPHWVHRIRFQCKSCHMELFEPRAGANRITMKDIGAGKSCGACHNGQIAFPATFGYCERCHVPAAKPPSASGP